MKFNGSVYRRLRATATLFAAWSLIALTSIPTHAARDRVQLDFGWKFSLESALPSGADPSAASYDDSQWRTVNIPHDYVIEQPFTKGLDPQHASLPTPTAWYRKAVFIPERDRNKDVWLDFDGIFRDAKIYVNGNFVVEHQSGYVPVHLDITPYAAAGKALTIAVHVDPSKFEGWWYEGGGIYRHVWLTMVDRLHIEPYGVYIVPTAVGDDAHPASADVQVSVMLKNSGPSSKNFSVVQRIFNTSGTLVASQTKAASEPIVRVQVKSTNGSVGASDVQALYGTLTHGEFALMVTLGTFTPPAKTFATSKSNLRLIDGAALAGLVLDHYEEFDSRYKSLIPLKRVYVPEAVDAQSD